MNTTQQTIAQQHTTHPDGTRTCDCATQMAAAATEVSASAARTLQFFLGHQRDGLRNTTGTGYHMELLAAGLIGRDATAEDVHRYRITAEGRVYLEAHGLPAKRIGGR